MAILATDNLEFASNKSHAVHSRTMVSTVPGVQPRCLLKALCNPRRDKPEILIKSRILRHGFRAMSFKQRTTPGCSIDRRTGCERSKRERDDETNPGNKSVGKRFDFDLRLRKTGFSVEPLCAIADCFPFPLHIRFSRRFSGRRCLEVMLDGIGERRSHVA